MANINESIQQLTASLQELTAPTNNGGCDLQAGNSCAVSAGELKLSQEVESFVEEAAAYSQKTKTISVGSY